MPSIAVKKISVTVYIAPILPPILINKNEKEVFKKPVYVTSTKNNVVVECSFEWNAGYSEDVLPFTNNNESTVFGYFKVCEYDEYVLKNILID